MANLIARLPGSLICLSIPSNPSAAAVTSSMNLYGKITCKYNQKLRQWLLGAKIVALPSRIPETLESSFALTTAVIPGGTITGSQKLTRLPVSIARKSLSASAVVPVNIAANSVCILRGTPIASRKTQIQSSNKSSK